MYLKERLLLPDLRQAEPPPPAPPDVDWPEGKIVHFKVCGAHRLEAGGTGGYLYRWLPAGASWQTPTFA
jgi:hypothetical protein